MLVHDDEYVNATKLHEKGLSPPAPDSQNWNHYVTNLIAVLCSFLLGFEDAIHQNLQPSTSTSTLPVSSAYLELSIKWFLRVLLTIFPCIKACSYGNELPSHLRCVNKYLAFSSLLHPIAGFCQNCMEQIHRKGEQREERSLIQWFCSFRLSMCLALYFLLASFFSFIWFILGLFFHISVFP